MKLVQNKKEGINYNEKITVEMTLLELVLIKTSVGHCSSSDLVGVLEHRNEHKLVKSHIIKDGNICHSLYKELEELDDDLMGAKR